MVKPPNEYQPKPVRWVGSSKEDLSDFPEEVRRRVGGALWEAQVGRKALGRSPVLKGASQSLKTAADFGPDRVQVLRHALVCPSSVLCPTALAAIWGYARGFEGPAGQCWGNPERIMRRWILGGAGQGLAEPRFFCLFSARLAPVALQNRKPGAGRKDR